MPSFEPIARPLLAAIFVAGGLDATREPEGKVAAARRVTARFEGVGPLPSDTAQLVRMNGACQVAAGLLLGLGIAPRICSLVLAGTLVPTTLAGHRFWELDGDERATQQIHFLKNLAMAGGLLQAAGARRRQS